MGPHVRIHEPKVGKFSPLISRHLVQHRALAVHHFVMTKWKHEVLVVVVHHAKGKFVLVELTEVRIHLEIVKRVMHPAHHPFHAEA